MHDVPISCECSPRPRPHVSGYFWKRIFFIRIKKYPRPHEECFRKHPRPHEDAAAFKIRCSNFEKRKQTIKLPFCCPQRSVRMLWYVVNQCCGVSVFEKLRFHPPHDNMKTVLLKRSTLESVFEKIRFWRLDPKRRLRVDANPKRIKKAFSKISGYVWTGPNSAYTAQEQHVSIDRRCKCYWSVRAV